jgi:hypothetical protein
MENPSYYAIIPANVRYDERLKANEKLMYGEITALSNKLGYCCASNKYFAELYKVGKETVSRWVSNLRDCGYILVDMQYTENGEISERRIFIAEKEGFEKQYPIAKKNNTLLRKKTNGIVENDKDNITSNNITSNNNDSPIKIEDRKLWQGVYKQLSKYFNGGVETEYLHREIRHELKTLSSARGVTLGEAEAIASKELEAYKAHIVETNNFKFASAERFVSELCKKTYITSQAPATQQKTVSTLGTIPI